MRRHDRVAGVLCGALILHLAVLASAQEREEDSSPKQPAGKPTPVKIVLEDFESGTTRWITNDINKQEGHGDVLLCEILATKPGAPGGSSGQAATVTFKRAADSWASASLPVDGMQWKEKGVRQFSFWYKGDGSDNDVDLILRGVTATGEEHKFSIALPLGDLRWHKVMLPLNRFGFHGLTADQHIAEIYLLQFVKRGSWPSLFFSIDDLAVEAAAQPPKVPQQPPTHPNAASAGHRVTVQFDGDSIGKVKTVLGANLIARPDLFLKNVKFRKSVAELGIRYVRILARRTVSMQRKGKAATYNFSELPGLVDAIRGINCEPLVCLGADPAWKLTDEELAGFCYQAVRTLNTPKRKPVAYWELLDKPTFGDNAKVIEEAVALYNRMRDKSLSAGSGITLGGIGEASPWRPHLETFLASAASLDFLSYQLYGTHNNSTSDADLIRSARQGVSVDLPFQVGPADVREAVAASAYKGVPIFITEAGPNALHAANGDSLDKRVAGAIGGAWYASLLAVSAPYVDALFPYEFTSPTWGLLDNRGRAYPAYYCLWMFVTYFPRAANLYPVEVDGDKLVALACRTRTASNVMIVNASGESVVCRAVAQGLKSPSLVRLRLLESNTAGLQFNELPPKLEQRVTLKAYSTVVLQFVE